MSKKHKPFFNLNSLFAGHLKDEKLRIDEIFEKIGQPFGEDRLAIEKGKQLKLELFE